MKIDVGEGTRAAGGAEDHNHNPIHGYGDSSGSSSGSASARSDELVPGSNRAVVQQQAASSAGVTVVEGAAGVHGAGGVRVTSVSGDGGRETGGPNLVSLPVQHDRRNDNNTREVDRSGIVGRDEFSQVIFFVFFCGFGRAFALPRLSFCCSLADGTLGCTLGRARAGVVGWVSVCVRCVLGVFLDLHAAEL